MTIHTRTFTVTIQHNGETPEAFDRMVSDFLTLPENPLLDAYGVLADDWDGPFIVAADVHAQHQPQPPRRFAR